MRRPGSLVHGQNRAVDQLCVRQVERWFKELTNKRLRRGVFSSVEDLIAAIEKWVTHWNDDPTPFVWHTPAAEIIEKVKRGRATLFQIKSATDH